MATFTDVQNSIAGLTGAINTLQTEIVAFRTQATGAITAEQADVIAEGINTATTALTGIINSIAPSPAP